MDRRAYLDLNEDESAAFHTIAGARGQGAEQRAAAYLGMDTAIRRMFAGMGEDARYACGNQPRFIFFVRKLQYKAVEWFSLKTCKT